MIRNISLLLLIFGLFSGCKNIHNTKGISKNQFAKLFAVDTVEGKIKLTTYHKDAKNSVLSSVILDSVPSRMFIMTSAQAGYLDALNSLQSIDYVSNRTYYFNQYFIDSSIKILGDFQNLNIEKLIVEKPDLVLFYKSSLVNMPSIQKLLEKEHIKYLICNEYEESTPLAQAEWILFYGAMLNRQNEANCLFDIVEQRYKQYQSLFNTSQNKVKILTGLPWKGQWYISGAASILSQFIVDAGGTYFYPHKTTENQSISLEKIYEYGAESDVWIDCGQAQSMKEIASLVPFASQIKSYHKSIVFNNNKRIAKGGAIDIWESGIVRPDLIIKDLYHIFHHASDPNLNDSLYYYRKLN